MAAESVLYLSKTNSKAFTELKYKDILKKRFLNLIYKLAKFKKKNYSVAYKLQCDNK